MENASCLFEKEGNGKERKTIGFPPNLSTF